MELKDVQQFIEENKSNEEVSAYLEGFKQLGVDEVQNYISQNDEGKRWFDSERDKHFSKGLETWKTNNLEKIISEEIRKRNPEKTPEQIENEKLRADFEKLTKELKLKDVKGMAVKVASEKQIPLDIIDYFVNEDEEKTLENLNLFQSVMDNYIKKQVDERLKGSYSPPNNNSNLNGMTKEKFNELSYSEKVKLSQDNPEVYKQFITN